VRQLLRVSRDLLREALARKWFLALFLGITLVLVVLGASLQLDVVDGALAGSRLFGSVLFSDIITVDRALGPLYLTLAYLAFYFGAFFLAVACSDFAPELLSPGRIEHLLSLPVARWQLLFGTYLGVVVLAAAATLYGSLGLSLVMGVKTGLWSLRLVVGSMVGWVGFCALYAAMLAAAFFVRSAAVSAAGGIATLVFGILASYREPIARVLEAGVGREAFRLVVAPFPRLALLATASAQLASDQPIDAQLVWRLIAAAGIFSAAMLALASWRFERQDF
jgi:Cu-processing system permease protein